MSCPHRVDVEVYVLGALEPAERRTFQTHLEGCAECRAALGDVAGLPGLLARAPEPVGVSAADTDTEAAAPGEVLTGALRQVRRRRRTRRALVGVVTAAALGLGVLVGVTVSGSTDPNRQVALLAVGTSTTSGHAGLISKPWGTEVALQCDAYAADPSRPRPSPDAPRTIYVLVVDAADGTQQEIARWSPPPGQDVAVSASTDLRVEQLRRLEVRTVSGQVLMQG